MKEKRLVLKRILACMVSSCMIISLCGCGKKSGESSSDTSISETTIETTPSTTEATTTIEKKEVLKNAPEAYLDAILIQINPSFIIFVNERDEVVRGEALNDDAKKLMNRVVLGGRSADEAIKDIVTSSIDEGYLKPGGTVNVTMVETFRTKEDAQNRLKSLEETVTQIGNEKKVEIKPATKINDDVEYAQEPVEQGPGDPGQDPNNPNNPNDPNDPNDPNRPDADPNQTNNDREPDHQHETDHQEPQDTKNDGGGNNGSGGGKQEGCPVCQGSGKCTRCDKDGYEDCLRCGKTGKMPCSCNGGIDPNPCACGNGNCYRCQGTGEFEGKTCDVCGGSGKCKDCGGTAQRKCNHCNGTGYLECDDCHGTGKSLCQGCHGTRVCEACGGSGLNPHKKS